MKNIFIAEAMNELRTIQDMLRWSVSCFNNENIWYGHGTDNAWDEAIQLVLPSLHLPLDIPENMRIANLIASEKYRIINRVILRINDRIPVAYLTNKAWFCGHEFYVDKRVFIPRSPIGELINKRFIGILHNQPKHILDIGTGSGCIAIACAYIFPKAVIDATDISIDALKVTEKNIEKHGLENRIMLIYSDIFCNIPALQQYNCIISNPPYVDAEDMSNLPNEYRHEPKIGLSSGSDGLKMIRQILLHASDYLTNDGALICEVGNSMIHLIKQYPKVPFNWLQFNRGGNGVFVLTKTQLLDSRKYFSIYKE